MILQVPFARNSSWAFAQMKGFALYGITIYIARIQFLNSWFKLEKYIRLFLILSLFFAIEGIMNQGRVATPTLGDQNDFCLFVNCLIPFAYFLGKKQRMHVKKYSIICVSCSLLLPMLPAPPGEDS